MRSCSCERRPTEGVRRTCLSFWNVFCSSPMSATISWWRPSACSALARVTHAALQSSCREQEIVREVIAQTCGAGGGMHAVWGGNAWGWQPTCE